MTFILRRPWDRSVKQKYRDAISKTGLKIKYEENEYEGLEDRGIAYIEINTLEDLMSLTKALDQQLIINCVDPPLIINCVDPPCCIEKPEIIIYEDYIE